MKEDQSKQGGQIINLNISFNYSRKHFFFLFKRVKFCFAGKIFPDCRTSIAAFGRQV
jgi:hypothetical protein